MTYFRVGDLFDSFKDFAKKLKDFEQTENVQFYRANSKKLEKCWRNGAYCNKVEEGYNKDLVFFEAYYKCKTINRKKKRTKCKAEIVLGVYKKKQLIIRKLQVEHNHQRAESEVGNDSEEDVSEAEDTSRKEDVNSHREKNQQQEVNTQGSSPERATKQAGSIRAGSQAVKRILKMLEIHLASTSPEDLPQKLNAIEHILKEWDAEKKQSPSVNVSESENSIVVIDGLPRVEALGPEPDQAPVIEFVSNDETQPLDISFRDLILSEPLNTNEFDDFLHSAMQDTSTLNDLHIDKTANSLPTSPKSEVLLNQRSSPTSEVLLPSMDDRSTVDENGNIEHEHVPASPKLQIVSDELRKNKHDVNVSKRPRVSMDEEERKVIRKIAEPLSDLNMNRQSTDTEGISLESDAVTNCVEDTAHEVTGYNFKNIIMPQKLKSRGRPRGSKSVTVIGLRRSTRCLSQDPGTSTDRCDSATANESDVRTVATVRKGRKSTLVKFEDKPVLSQIKKMLQWLEIPDAANVVNGVRQIRKTDLRLNPLTLRDSFGTDEANIENLRAYFESETFDDFVNIINAKKKMSHFTCPNCTRKCHERSRLCAGCLLQWHHECVSSSHTITKDIWFCQSCEDEIDG